METYLEERLAAYPHEGIGEFHVRRTLANDEDILRAVASMAIKRNIPVHIHSGAAPVEQFFSYQPKLTVIWAHVGMTEPANVAMRMFDKYPNLYADTSFRENDIYTGSGLDPEWEKVLRKHHKRIMIGSDTWVNGQWAIYDAIIDINRKWLSHLPRGIAEDIAYKNAERLFGRKIDMSLIGTK